MSSELFEPLLGDTLVDMMRAPSGVYPHIVAKLSQALCAACPYVGNAPRNVALDMLWRRALSFRTALSPLASGCQGAQQRLRDVALGFQMPHPGFEDVGGLYGGRSLLPPSPLSLRMCCSPVVARHPPGGAAVGASRGEWGWAGRSLAGPMLPTLTAKPPPAPPPTLAALQAADARETVARGGASSLA